MIKKYDPLIYPINLYIGISKDPNALLKDFIDNDTDEPLHNNWKYNDAVVFSNVLDRDNNYCLIMLFSKEPSIPLMVHELSHISYRLWEHVGEKEMGNEANAYLQEWIAKCYTEYLKEYKEQNKNDTSLENK